MTVTDRPLKALIVDDEAPARGELRYLLEEAGGVSVIGEAASATEALQLIGAIPYDVVFLDIEMPGLSGIELAATLRGLERRPAVVFVTAYGEHAVKAFEVAAVDYLVKPVEPGRLRLALERVATTLPAGVPARQPSEVETPARLDRIPVDRRGRKLLVPSEDALFISAYDDYTYVHTAEGRFLSNLSMNTLESRLAPLGFFRTHRSYLVNLSRVKEVVPMYGGTLMLTLTGPQGAQIPVSRRRASSLKKALGM